MRWEIVEDHSELSERGAELMLEAIAQRPRIVLGLPTGRTPEGLYAHVVQHCGQQYKCFQNVTTFNLDEYVGIPAEHPGSYASYMRRNLFDHVDIKPEHVHIPDGRAQRILARQPELTASEALTLECQRYEDEIADAGGLQLTFLGLGTNGHIGFNEPGSSVASRTRLIELAASTRASNASLFPDGNVPQKAITMGIGTILESARIVLLASGGSKAEAVARLATAPISEDFPASALKTHPDVTVIVDREAAALLDRA